MAPGAGEDVGSESLVTACELQISTATVKNQCEDSSKEESLEIYLPHDPIIPAHIFTKFSVYTPWYPILGPLWDSTIYELCPS